MKFRDFFKNEDGAVAVIVAISLTVLLGITAAAIDFGRLASCRQSLQNAADAAALAAAADKGAGKPYGEIYGTMKQYCALNGFDPDDRGISASLIVQNKTVTVRIEKTLDMGFSSVLTGQNNRTVSALAAAEAISVFGDCEYAMFAGQKIEEDGTGISITGNNIRINGNIHSNSDITMINAVLGAGSVATAVRNVRPSTTGWNSNSIALDMPSFKSFESALNNMTKVVEFGSSVVKNSMGGFEKLIQESIDQYHHRFGADHSYLYNGLYIRIHGDLTFNGHDSTAYTPMFPIILIVDGDIDLNGAPLNSTCDYPVSIMSKSGDITVNGGGCTYTGILYAPEGNITLNGNNACFVGMIVSMNIRKSGGNITVTYYKDADRFLPDTKVHLIG